MIHKLIVTFFGLGFAPKAPGTFGALGACALFIIFHIAGLPPPFIYLILIIIFFAGVWSSGIVQKYWGEDNNKIVIDEVLGMGVSLMYVPLRYEYYLAAFGLFRLLDITKPLFISHMEKLKGGWGVMMDDLLAGIYTCLLMQLIIYYYP